MKVKTLAFALLSLVATNSALAGTVTGSSNISFLAFDGQKFDKKKPIQINDDKLHQVVLTVSTIYQSGSDNNFFESSPIILTFNGNPENIQILAPNLRNRYDVDKFKENPAFKIKTQTGEQLSYKKDYLKGEGFMPDANITSNLANYNAGEGIAAVKQFATLSMATLLPMQNAQATKGKVMVQGENIAEQQLQYWFQQADKETQKRFLDWAKKH